MTITNIAQSERLAFSVAEAVHLTGLGRTTLYGMMSRGELASRKVGARRLIPALALRQLLEQSDETPR